MGEAQGKAGARRASELSSLAMDEREEGRQTVKRELFLNNVSLYHLGRNVNGSPKHPLYLSKETKPQLWMK